MIGLAPKGHGDSEGSFPGDGALRHALALVRAAGDRGLDTEDLRGFLRLEATRFEEVLVALSRTPGVEARPAPPGMRYVWAGRVGLGSLPSEGPSRW